MPNIYEGYQELIACYPGDEVVVFSSRIDINAINPNDLTIGRIDTIDQRLHEDWLGDIYLHYDISIIMPDRKKIKIRDSFRQVFLRKNEFITMNDYIRYTQKGITSQSVE